MNSEVCKKFMDELLIGLKKKGGSDLFIVAGAAPSARVHGDIAPLLQKKLSPGLTKSLVHSIMTEEEIESYTETKECNFAIALDQVARFRVNAFVQRGSCGMVVRIISTEIPTIDELKLPQILKQLAISKRGLIIFVGGTGSGKSTSLAALIDYRNENTRGHIITIEDPVEFVHKHKGCIVTQREVGTDTENFEVALKNTLRQAPDVILIGEIRDRQTMEHAIAFAETGHLCLATLHANNTNQAMDRIINFFPEERHNQLLLDLSLNLRSVISQRLLPTPNGKGRVAAIEILINTPLMSNLIEKGDINEMKNLIKKSAEHGMQTFDQALFELIESNSITMEEAMKNADSVNDLRLRIKLEGGRADAMTGVDPDSLTIDGLEDDESQAQNFG